MNCTAFNMIILSVIWLYIFVGMLAHAIQKIGKQKTETLHVTENTQNIARQTMEIWKAKKNYTSLSCIYKVTFGL